MNRKNKTSGNHFQDASSIQLNIGFPNVYESKDSEYFTNRPIHRRIYELLKGGRYSVVELTKILSIPDPRSCIRDLRNEGITISDYWVKSPNSRYKVYFIQ